jgi:protein phosphatase 2C-like protein
MPGETLAVQDWRILGVSTIGSAHVTGALPCQDACAMATVTVPGGEPSLILVAADGAGSAPHGEEGARFACERWIELVTPYLASGGMVGGVSRLQADDWCWEIGETIRREAEAAGATPREYACTLLGALVGPDAAAGFQVGDGAIVVADAALGYRPLFWPQRGEYANMTHFVTEPDAVDRLAFTVVPEPVDEIALLTDGLQSLGLHYATETAHAPFFEHMFRPLRAIPATEIDPLHRALAAYLGSETVTRRTDDDKTLVLATRRPAAHVVVPQLPTPETAAADVP